MRTREHLCAAVVLLSLVGCGATGAMGTRNTRSDVITRQELRETNYTSIYAVVLASHPNWLRTRGIDSFRSPTRIKVYLDNFLYGETSVLREITPASVAYVRWFNPIDAGARWGLGHSAGVIFVSTMP